LLNFIKIDPYNFELYRFKVCAFFEIQCTHAVKKHCYFSCCCYCFCCFSWSKNSALVCICIDLRRWRSKPRKVQCHSQRWSKQKKKWKTPWQRWNRREWATAAVVVVVVVVISILAMVRK